MFLAKLGSTMAKPDGVAVIPADRIQEYLRPLPVSAIWGVGERTEATLHRLGLGTVRDLAEAPLGMLRSALGPAMASHLHELANGRDPRSVTPEHVEKSIGAETTFDLDITDLEVVRRVLLALAGKVAVRLRAAGQSGRTVSLKVRFADFRTINRSRTLAFPTDVAREVFEIALALYTAVPAGEQIRLLGVRVEGLTGAGSVRQPVLGDRADGWREAEQAADAVSARFGTGLVGPASLLHSRELRPDGNGGTPGPLTRPE